MQGTSRITITLPLEMEATLKQEAANRKLPLSEYCRLKLGENHAQQSAQNVEDIKPIRSAEEAEARAAEVHELLQFMIEERHDWMKDMKELQRYVAQEGFFIDCVLRVLLSPTTYDSIQKKFNEEWENNEQETEEEE